MAVQRSRTHAGYGVGRRVAAMQTPAHRGSGHRAHSDYASERARLVREVIGVPYQPPRRHAMAFTGTAVLAASILGTVLGHLLGHVAR